ncbi:PH domain-containing protein [Mycolicibacterium sp. S2-37]|uniref:PH domain-containing protein n=1 Tax=Mycolicibacterium sp. S2-37 TaxID=2810297 RepID=UPI001A94BD5A|nr:PH domain-containing protein [Mycolicibacterium sp. S2-37]MBO0677289.1 PH domain-containing protein [Mycolicibacterium sp. S2-37]
MAHLAVGFFTLGLLSVVLANPRWFTVLMVIPVFASALIVRLRTVADADGVTARTLLRSRTLAWQDIEGLRFGRGSWARATLADGTEVTLPAVTFGTLPRLTAASAGRVPNPYR